jgi:ABC-2 type transport system permease protein
MNTQSNAVPDSPLGAQGIAPAAMSVTRPMYWSVRRELWENRSIYIAPLAVAGFALVGFLIATIGRSLSTPDLAERRTILEEPYSFATALIMGAATIVALFYCLEALHGERRDRSILFWKSLPVSDLTTVLSKASIPFVILPGLAFVVTVATNLIMLLLSTAVLKGSGLSAAALWAQLWLFQMQLLYHLVTVHVLWYAPIYAWLLLVSGWARRAAFLWAGLPPLAIFIIEKLAFNTSHFAALLRYRFTGPEEFDFTEPGSSFALHPMMHLNLGKFLSTPGLWTGLLVAAIFLAAAVRLRRYQGPI